MGSSVHLGKFPGEGLGEHLGAVLGELPGVGLGKHLGEFLGELPGEGLGLHLGVVLGELPGVVLTNPWCGPWLASRQGS